ncbi:hypothetical protein MC885_012249 [Smutsia gigantea]|nr:hypothetical protein MC885_012249 [Smutsia gigantea]
MAAAAGEARRVLVYGGRGALGSRCVQAFRARNWWVASIDVVENEEASASVVVKMTDSFTEQADQVSLLLFFPASSGPWCGVPWTHQWWPVTELSSPRFPGMIGYGMAKGAVHQLCQSLAGKNSGMPSRSAAIALLPVTLDTPVNRKSMPEADFSSWTPLEFLVETFHDWITEKNRPSSGSLIQVVTTEGKTELTPAYF